MKAYNLFVTCSKFDIIFSLAVAKYFLYLLLPITSSIQKRDLDIKKGYNEVDFVLEGLKNAKTVKKSEVLGRFAETVPEKKRICKTKDQCNVSFALSCRFCLAKNLCRINICINICQSWQK